MKLNYFTIIDTEDKAYLLGYIYADGKIDKELLTINSKVSDIEILEHLQKCLGTAEEVTFWKDRCQSVFDLPTELSIDMYPNNIPDELEHHFMRGFFDGDGCISIHTNERKGHGGDRGQVNIASNSYEFITRYVNKLVEYIDVKKNKINRREDCYVIDWSGLTDVENIFEFLYKDATIYLKRKKELFDKVMIISAQKIKYRKK